MKNKVCDPEIRKAAVIRHTTIKMNNKNRDLTLRKKEGAPQKNVKNEK